MDVKDVSALLTMVADIGLPLVIAGGTLYIIWRVSNILPDSIKGYIAHNQAFEKRQQEYYEKRQAQYDEQMQIIITVAQQGVEAQKRGNEVIERNNIIMEARYKNDEQIATALTMLIEQCNRTECTAKENGDIIHKAYMEAIRVSERLNMIGKP